MNGWFPDPGGEPGRYRYWDGSTWSETTSDDPRDGPPRPGLGGNDGRTGRTRVGMVVGVLAVVVIVAVAAIVLRGSGGVRPTTDDPLPTTTLSGGDDRSPSPNSATPSPSGSRNAESPCPVGDPNGRIEHPQDGRVHGGDLSFAVEPTFEPAKEEARFTFAHDITQQVQLVHQKPGWLAQLAVGQVQGVDGFGPKTADAAEIVVECAVTSQLYNPYRATRHDLRSEPITVDGQAGWVIESQVLVDVAGLPFHGDHAIFVLVPDGRNWGLFFGAVPIGDTRLDAVLARTVQSLRVG